MNKKGYTLIEVAVAMAILSIMILPVSSVFVSSIIYNIRSEEKLIVNNIARNYMEMAIHEESIQSEYLYDDYKVEIIFEDYNMYSFLQEVKVTVSKDAKEMLILKSLKEMR